MKVQVIEIRYASIRSIDISNGAGIGVSLFVQGCPIHCKNCFNPETWDFNGWKKWTEKVKENFFELIDRPYIERISILGGEPLANESIRDVFILLRDIRSNFPDKTIWIYTGYKYEDMRYKNFFDLANAKTQADDYRNFILTENYCDILVDGKYIESQKDFSLMYRGSRNQRVIDIKKSLEKGEVVLWNL